MSGEFSSLYFISRKVGERREGSFYLSSVSAAVPAICRIGRPYNEGGHMEEEGEKSCSARVESREIVGKELMSDLPDNRSRKLARNRWEK